MNANILRGLLCWTLIALVPVSLGADGVGVAMVHPYGAAWLNGTVVERASAVLPGDLSQTDPGSFLKIKASDSSVTVLSDSVVRFDGDSVSVVHGGAKLTTLAKMTGRAGIVTVTPASRALTEFQLTHAAGTIQVVALKGDLQISNGSETTALSQGQEATQTDADKDQNKDQKKAKQGKSTPIKGGKATQFIIGAAAVAGAGSLGH